MHQRFTPYGTLLARDSAGSSMPRGLHVGWTGREYDAETGFTFHRARYYSPDLRRWTQEDPIGYAGGGNLYAYVGGAVMEARDPSGLIEDLSGRGLGFAEASRPNENYELPPWPGGGGKRGGLLNTSYIEDDGYLDDLMAVLFDAGNGRSGCSGSVCATNMDEYNSYVGNFMRVLGALWGAVPSGVIGKGSASLDLSEVNPLTAGQYALVAGGGSQAGLSFQNPQVGEDIVRMLNGGQIGSARKTRGGHSGMHARVGGFSFIVVARSYFTSQSAASGVLEGCLVHEWSHAATNAPDVGPGNAYQYARANSYDRTGRHCAR